MQKATKLHALPFVRLSSLAKWRNLSRDKEWGGGGHCSAAAPHVLAYIDVEYDYVV